MDNSEEDLKAHRRVFTYSVRCERRLDNSWTANLATFEGHGVTERLAIIALFREIAESEI